MCSYCLRGSRPNFDKVKSVYDLAPPSLEKTLVGCVLQRSSEAYEEAKKLLVLMDSGKYDEPLLLSRS